MNLLYIPAVLLMACFVLYPLARGIYISFFKWNGYSQNMTFIGLKNYLSLLSDKYFKSSFWNTMLYGFGSALLQNVFGLALALFLNSKFKIRNAVRTIIYLPVMISGLLMGYIMYFFFQLNHGVINEIFQYLGKDAINWLADGTRGKIIITLVNSWQYVGIAMIVYLAGLQNIPSMYYEAATLDGGNKWQIFRHVTLPLLTPAMSTAVIQNVIGGLKLNDVIISLTKGGPTLKTHSLSTYISYMYFDSEKAGYASAVGAFLFVFIFIISTFLTRYFRKREVQY
jgi:raffinose/stachyose/melibiose transport system permease protein